MQALILTHTTVCLNGYSNSLSMCFCWDSLEITQCSGVCSAVRGRQLSLPQNQWPCLQRVVSGFRGGDWNSSFTTPTRQKSNATTARQVLSKGQSQTNPVYIDSGRTSQPTRPSAPTAALQDLLWPVSKEKTRSLSIYSAYRLSQLTFGTTTKKIIQNSLQHIITIKNYIRTAFTQKGARG